MRSVGVAAVGRGPARWRGTWRVEDKRTAGASRRRLWRRAALGTVGMVLAVGAATASAKTTITFQYNWYAVTEQNPAFEAMIEAFNRTHPDIEVKGFVVQGTYDKLLASIAAGVAADVVHFESSAVIEWAAKGLLEPLDELYNPATLRRDFYPSDAAEVIWNGRVWGLPGYTNVRGLYWNVDILDELGLDSSRAPASMAELDEWARKAAKTDAQGRFVRVGFLPWLGSFYPAGWFWTFGGDIYDPATGMPTLERPENIRAWEWVQEWARRYPPGQLAFNATRGPSGADGFFLSGSLVARTAADNFVNTIRRYFPDMNLRTGEVPHPDGGRNGTWGGGIGYIIPRGAKHPQEARIFLRWIATEGLTILFQQLDQLPAHIGQAQRVLRTLPANDRRLPLFAQAGARNPRPPLWANVIGRLLQVEGSDIITLRQNPRTVLANLQREMVPLYEGLRPR